MATLGDKTVEVRFTASRKQAATGEFFDANIQRVKTLIRYGASPEEIVSKLGVSPEEAYLLVEAAKILLM